MGFRCGIVGLPNVGKSTLFNALTETAAAQAANYPFCTIEPNVGRVAVPDARLDKIAAIAKSAQEIETQIEFVDIAGLVRGASKGEGLGNQFLANIREVDAIAHVVRCFEGDVIHVAGKVDPIADIETIDTELALADLESVDKALNRAERAAKANDKEALAKKPVLQKLAATLNEGRSARSAKLDEEEKALVRDLFLLTLKPLMYIANVLEDGFEHNPLLEAVRERAVAEGAEVVPVCAAIEEELAQLDEADRDEFLKDMGLDEPGLNRVIRAGYKLLDLQTYFTAGVKEVRAWQVKRGATAPQAAGVIHTDFERGFIRAETVGYDDFIQYKGEAGAAAAGRLRKEGKEYIVKDGDVLHFLFNV